MYYNEAIQRSVCVVQIKSVEKQDTARKILCPHTYHRRIAVWIPKHVSHSCGLALLYLYFFAKKGEGGERVREGEREREKGMGERKGGGETEREGGGEKDREGGE